MKYRGKGTQMWDAWFLNHEETVHAFHLQLAYGESDLPETEKQAVGHICSHDLLHWEFCGNVLPPLFDEQYMDDYHAKFTGCAFSKDNRHYVYYTMRRAQDASQRIGVAISDDLKTFPLYPDNPVLEPDSRVLIGYDNKDSYHFGIVDCRDLVVVYHEAEGLYYGYFAAAADVGRQSPVGVIAVAVSHDLIHWRDQSIVYVPRQNGMIEVPDVYELDGKWYLTVLCGNSYNGRSSTGDDYVSNATIYAVADHPRGPFVEPEDNIFIGGVEASGFTCRTVLFHGKRYVLYVDRSGGGWTLSLPKEVKVMEGRLQPRYTPLLEALRTGEWKPAGLTLNRTSFAWNTYGGQFEMLGEGACTGRTGEMDYQIAWFDACEGEAPLANLEMEMCLTVRAEGAGFAFYAEDQPWMLSLEPRSGRLLLMNGYGFSFTAGRHVALPEGEPVHVRLLIIDGTLECYLDGALVLQCGIPRFEEVRPGLFCDRGEMACLDLRIFRLER